MTNDDRRKARSLIGLAVGADIDRNSLETLIAEALAAARQEERAAAIKDVCMYCGGRALGYYPAEGPNGAGNWIHKPKGGGEAKLCNATGIHARAKYAAAIEA